MAYGLQVMNAAGTVVFDSNVSIGAVCLGIYSVAAAGSTFTFSSFPGGQGRFMYAGGGADNSYTIDSTLGYPRFIFAGNGIAAYDVVLFVF